MSSLVITNQLNHHGTIHHKPQPLNFTNDVVRHDYNYFETDDDLLLHPQVPNKKLKRNHSDEKPEEVSSASKGVSRAILAGKYLLQFEDNVAEGQVDPSGRNCISNTRKNNTPIQLSPTKTPLKCLNLGTKEVMQCRISARDDRGVNILAAHERLGGCSEFVNPISELIVTPKYFCRIYPMTYGTLHSYVYSKSKLKEAEAKRFFKQMVSIVEFCHAKGIILRDLKMGRFVFTDKERTILKLDSLEDVAILPKPDSIDDGLDDHHGCPNYVSPEKAECVTKGGPKYSGKSTDVWALGISLYAMLAGRYPFNDTDVQRLLYKIRNCFFYPMVEGVSPLVKSLIRCLLVKSPRDRPSCKELLSHPWFKNDDFHVNVPTPASRTRVQDEPEGDFKVKRMRMSDDQVVPGS